MRFAHRALHGTKAAGNARTLSYWSFNYNAPNDWNTQDNKKNIYRYKMERWKGVTQQIQFASDVSSCVCVRCSAWQSSTNTLRTLLSSFRVRHSHTLWNNSVYTHANSMQNDTVSRKWAHKKTASGNLSHTRFVLLCTLFTQTHSDSVKLFIIFIKSKTQPEQEKKWCSKVMRSMFVLSIAWRVAPSSRMTRPCLVFFLFLRYVMVFAQRPVHLFRAMWSLALEPANENPNGFFSVFAVCVSVTDRRRINREWYWNRNVQIESKLISPPSSTDRGYTWQKTFAQSMSQRTTIMAFFFSSSVLFKI